MLMALLVGIALAGTATLHVGVHRQAGTVYDIAADGAAGMCTVEEARVTCPADGPVTFRWGPGGPWTLVGQSVVAPGEVGVAFVLATEESRTEQRALLAARPIEPETVRNLFLRAGEVEPPAPSAGMVDDLVALGSHPDPKIRRAVIDALTPFWRRTASDPLPPTAPTLVPEHLIRTFAADQDPRVRRRLAARLRELRQPSESVAMEAQSALLALVSDRRSGVQRAATATLSHASRDGAYPAELSWEMALENVGRPGPPGRAAANTLKQLRPFLDPERVDAAEAVHRVLLHHPERAWHVWSAWKEDVPWRRDWAERLFLETVGLDRALLRYWAERHPVELSTMLRRWESAPPHSERWEVVRAWLADTPHSHLRAALELPSPDLPQEQ